MCECVSKPVYHTMVAETGHQSLNTKTKQLFMTINSLDIIHTWNLTCFTLSLVYMYSVGACHAVNVCDNAAYFYEKINEDLIGMRG